MALMTEERRKEMEEEMNRFELEISAPKPNDVVRKPLSPPPRPPAVGNLIPKIIPKGPPLSSKPPAIQAILRAPPPPPPPPVIQVRPQIIPTQFIPHQLQRQPPRPTIRHGFIPVQGLTMGGPPGPFPHGPFMSPMGQFPGSPMQPMAPGPMHMPPGAMPMHPQMGLMGPPTFCTPGMPPVSNNANDSQPFVQGGLPSNFDRDDTNTTSNEPTSVVASPAVYASPFVKTNESSDKIESTNGQENYSTLSKGITTSPTKAEKLSYNYEVYSVGPVIPQATVEETVPTKKEKKKKKTVRMAGGQAWEDNSLLEWDPDDFRIFCGDLGNDVTDEVLIRSFSKYPSFVKAKVIRDKRTNKTKGFGFVSFKDPQDFIKAMREMNGKYVGSRPIKLRKSTWRDRNIDIVKKKQREKEKLGLL